MSDQLSAAAQALGVPEAIVERSARARAEASGQSYEQVLAAWAGGEAISATAPAETPTPDTAQAPAETPEETEAPAPAPSQPAAPATPAAPTGAPARAPSPTPAVAVANGRAPVLEAPPDRPLAPVVGGLGVLVLTILLGFVFPALPAASDQVRSSAVPFSAQALDGQVVYLHAGCASCHTQAIRPVVADVGLGPVTLSDTNQVLGFRRLGPDLADVGSRLDSGQISAILTGGTHPAMPLSSSAMADLVAYLSESIAPKAVGVAEGGQS